MIRYLRQVYQAWIDYPLRAGHRLQGRYEIVRFLGEGSYGLAYLSTDRQTGERVVVKQSKPSKRGLGRKLLRREQEALLALTHPSIPKCRGLFEDGKRLFLVTDWIDGATVEDLIFEQQRGFSELESLAFIARLLPVVRFVHERGWVHLDLRIPNVMVRDGTYVLIDFGLARRIGDTEGLEPFSSEEEERRRLPDVKSDWYAVGHFLLFLLYSGYEAQEGQPPGEWHEELSLSMATGRLLRRLLRLDEAYESDAALMQDVEAAIAALT
ncbi:protein kinase [Paenibacillus validus]|uniref:serine/threonine protein kinase n=1 Tax=Paenibacillus TaxID=44249 RepID=UPI000FDA51DC|nr:MULTISPECIES: protein kinase [Paenibacillus]MED4603509.1 protein kinase [Paenibacillus validus]MED4605356.1 protein kinase [Paenibacillus validus]